MRVLADTLEVVLERELLSVIDVEVRVYDNSQLRCRCLQTRRDEDVLDLQQLLRVDQLFVLVLELELVSVLLDLEDHRRALQERIPELQNAALTLVKLCVDLDHRSCLLKNSLSD